MWIELNPRARNLSGERFARLTVLGPVEKRKNGHVVYLCRCDCGGEARATCSNLKSGHTNSCGCLMRERTSNANSSHGRSKTRLYSVWMQMRQRCYLKTAPNYKWYGGKGVKVCKRWRKFENFADDMGEPPPNHSLDRIDPEGNYEPSNCRWASSFVQSRNKSSNVYVTIGDRRMILTDWARDLGVSSQEISRRFRRGELDERALGPSPIHKDTSP